MAWTTATTRASGYLVTAAVWNSEHVDNMNYLKEVGYAEITADVSVTATTEATANSVISLGAITYEAVPHMIEFCSAAARPDATVATRQLNYSLQDGTTVINLWGYQITPAAAAATQPVHLMHRFTPTAASHTYNVKAWVSAGTGTINAGPGSGSLSEAPAFLRVTRIPV